MTAKILGLTLALVILGSTANAQSAFSYAFIGAGNTSSNVAPITLETSDTGTLVSTSLDRDFNGRNRAGAPQTMNYNATTAAESAFGRLRSRVEGTLTPIGTVTAEANGNISFTDEFPEGEPPPQKRFYRFVLR